MTADADAVARRLEAALGGRVTALQRHAGGASRITSTFELERPPGSVRRLVLQQVRGTSLTRHPGIAMEATLLRLADGAGVPVPEVVAAGSADGLEDGWLVVERLEGESIPRRILRDDGLAAGRSALTGQLAAALAAIHTIDPTAVPALPPEDPLHDPLPVLDALGEVRPVLELGVRWLARTAPQRGPAVVVHGDYRMGNLLVDGSGLVGVLDWELAHRGDPAEDIGWLCSRSWRFGGGGQVGGVGHLDEFLAAYAAAGGRPVSEEEVRWWEAYASVKWAVICLLQASTHLTGTARSVELAAIGRRVCECEWDLLGLLGSGRPASTARAPSGPTAEVGGRSTTDRPFGTPTAAELLEAVGEYLESKVMVRSEGGARFEARVARNVVDLVRRELRFGPAAAAAHAARLRSIGVPDDSALVAAVRAGEFDGDLIGLGTQLAGDTFDQLTIANPSYLGPPDLR